ncbi:hypothetical protein ACFOD4_05735 [Pseudoroseomonas globiformis]|uniref:DUF3467 domain-containing protein n=1 Tax=Teichococcus globiformis TaxID=2307229 RepID=A0ABV7FY57_9PROT
MSQPVLFADGVIEASVHFGVARITLGQSGPDGKPQAAGQLAIPVMQLPGFTKSLQSLLQQFESKMRQAQQVQPPRPEGEAEAPPASDAFRFSGG